MHVFAKVVVVKGTWSHMKVFVRHELAVQVVFLHDFSVQRMPRISPVFVVYQPQHDTIHGYTVQYTACYNFDLHTAYKPYMHLAIHGFGGPHHATRYRPGSLHLNVTVGGCMGHQLQGCFAGMHSSRAHTRESRVH